MNSLNSLCLMGRRSLHEKLCPFYYILYEMENTRMPELKALAREHRLRGYSRLRKAELIAFHQDNEPQAPRRQRPPHQNRPPLPPPQMSTWELQWEPQIEVRQSELEAPLTKKQYRGDPLS